MRLVKLMQGKGNEFGNNSVTQYRCLIYQESICAKFLKAKSITVIKVDNFICFKGLNHGEFEGFLHTLETELKNVVYYSEIRCLSIGKCWNECLILKRKYQHAWEDKKYQLPDLTLMNGCVSLPM